jgi:hypothetical protein
MAMLEMIARGNKSIAENRFRPADQVLDELDERIEASRRIFPDALFGND